MFTRPRRFKYSNLYHIIRVSPVLFAFILGFCTAILFQSLFQRPDLSPHTLPNTGVHSTKSQLNSIGKLNANSNDNSISNSKHEAEFLIIVILSSPKNRNQRRTIRESWLKLGGTHRRYRAFFLVGTFGLSSEEVGHLEKEHSTHSDMLLLPEHRDSYRTLTDKLLSALKWLWSESISYDYLLKVDDDSFVRLNNLYDELVSKDTQLTTEQRAVGLYWGYFDGRAPVKRTGVWSESDWFLCDRYLPYALGGGYIISRNLVDFIAANAGHLKRYNSEDVSVGSWLAALNVNRIHDIRFDTEYVSRGCIESFLIQHKQSPTDMRAKYESLDQFQKLCPTGEMEHRLAYEYNWRLQPSMCCTRNLSMSN